MIKKDIIIFYPSFERGGATINLINFANLSSKRNNVYLISNINNKDKRNFFSKKINLYKISNFSLKIISNRLITSLLAIYNMIKIFNKIGSKNSIIVSFQSHIVSIFICKIFGKKIIIRNSEDVLGATKYADYKIFAYLVMFLKTIFYFLSDAIITNSKKAKNSLQKITFYKKKIDLIYNPYLIKIKKIKLKKRKNIILSVGRLCKQKNQELLIKAFSIFLKKYPDYKLVLIGHGADKVKLVNICNNLKIMNKVEFKGWLTNPNYYYENSKLFVFPSLYEGLPNALIDSVNNELPCISSKCSGAEDILTNKYGTFSNDYDYNLLSKKMIDSIKNYNDSLKKVKKIKYYLHRFLAKEQISKYLSLTNKILSK
tara:strand:- start:44 stop:1156 length:1113 start_codon:yes stop_codon:yes gene_type:complete